MKIKQIIALAFLVVVLSSCGSKAKKDKIDSVTQATETDSEVVQNPQDFDVVDNEASANAMNEQSQAKIDEVEVSDRVFFDLNSASISDDAKKILDTQAAWLKSDSTISITIEGNCDERGAREYNLALGEKRANVAKKYLVSKGVESSRIKTISYGKERPSFIGSGETIWSKNRNAITVVN